MAAQKLGIPQVPVMVLRGLSEAQKRAYVIADNKIALNAGWDDALLKQELQELSLLGFDLELTGFDTKELTGIVVGPERNLDPDAAPPLPLRPRSTLGTIWACGTHRVICGDSTHGPTVQALMAGESADVAWTDPPYNVSYEGSAGKIKNDSMGDAAFRLFLESAFGQMASVMKAGASIYVAHADTEGLNFRAAFAGAGFKLSSCLVWRKNALVLGRSDYQWIHEPILYGWKLGASHRWFGGRKQTTMAEVGERLPFVEIEPGKFQIEIGEQIFLVEGKATITEMLPTVFLYDRPSRSETHPTMKPVGIIERHLANSARRGDVVLDLFGGSGSTLIAGDRMGMGARLCELDPKFVDVIVERWQEYSGEVAVRESDGAAFNEVPRGD
jgi:DNA modification methylase